MNRWLHGVLATLVVWLPLTLAALLLLGAAALQTAWLRDLVIHEALDRSVEEWSIERIEGRLLGDLSLHGIAIGTPAADLAIGKLSLRVAIPRLLVGTVALERLSIVDLDVTLGPPTPDSGDGPGFTGFSTPAPVDLDALLLDRASLVLANGDRHELTRLELRARLRGTKLNIDRLRLALPRPDVVIRGSTSITLSPELPWQIDLEAQLRDVAPEVLAGELGVAIDARGDRRAAAGRLIASGAVSAELEVQRLHFADLDVAARLRLLNPLAIAGLTLLDGSLELEGVPEDWRVALAATVDDPPAPLKVAAPLELVVDGRGSTTVLEVTSAHLTGRNGNVLRGRGDVRLEAPRTARAELEGTDLDVAAWLPGWRSRLDLALRAAADIDRGSIDIDELSLQGHWNGSPTALSMTGAVELPVADDSGTLAFDLPDLDLRIGDNRIDGSVRSRDGELDTDLRIAGGHLAELWPGLAGRIDGTLRSRGSLRAPRAEVDIEASNLAWEDASLEIAALQLSGSSALLADGATDISMAIEGAQAPGLADPLSMTGRLTGTGPELELDLDLTSGGIKAAARMQADARDPTQLLISALRLEEPLLGRWQLERADQATLPLRLSRTTTGGVEGITFSGACLGASGETDIDPARACWQGGRADADGVQLDAVLSGLDLRRFGALLPPQLRLRGVVGAEVRIDGRDAKLNAAANGGELELLDDTGETLFEDRIETLQLDLQRDDAGRTTFRLDARLPIAGSVGATGTLEEVPNQHVTAAALAVDLEVGIDDLRPLRPLLRGLEDASGSLNGSLRVRGTLGEPTIDGALALEAGARVPALGVRIEPIRARLTGTGPQSMALDASLSFSGVPLRVAGDLAWDAQAGLSFDGTATGEAIPLLRTPELTATASPDLGIDYDSERLRISGRIRVPGAFAEFKSLPEGSETLSRDVVIHGDEAVAVDDGLATDIDLTVELGRDVRIKAGSFEATVIGQLALRKPVNGTLTARGRLETTSGGVVSYGESLRLSRGNLSFDGPIDNPAIDVLAVRNVGRYEVGLSLTGYFSSLDTRLYSSPAVDDATTLTMLVTGREPTEATSADMDRVQSAALGLGISQAAPMIDALADRVGIDELVLENPMDEDTGAVVVGKELSKGLYARYTYGLRSRIGGLILEYRINDAFSVRSETGAVNAIDVVFRREYD